MITNTIEVSPQQTATIPESYLLFAGSERLITSRQFLTPWVEASLWLSQCEAEGAPQESIEIDRKKYLSEKVLLYQAEKLFTKKQAAIAFNELLGHFAEENEDFSSKIHKYGVPDTQNQSINQEASVSFDFVSFFNNPNTPNDQRLTLVEAHTNALELAQERLGSKAPELLDIYQETLLFAVDIGFLPESSIPDEDRQKLILGMYVNVSDPVTNALSEIHGHFDPQANTTFIDANVVFRESSLDDIFFHELTHAHSGKTVLAQIDEYSQMDTLDFSNIDIDSLNVSDLLNKDKDNLRGLSVYARRIGLQSDNFFEFNEAVTEYIKMLLLGNRYDHVALWSAFQEFQFNSDSLPETNIDRFANEVKKNLGEEFGYTYLAERIMLAGLVSLGIDENIFFGAYFESYKQYAGKGKSQKAARFILDGAVSKRTPFRSLRSMMNYLRQMDQSGGKEESSSWHELLTLDEDLFEEGSHSTKVKA